jgi:hypothetical protein
MEELKPCPFCGIAPKYTYSEAFDNHSYGCNGVACDVNPAIQGMCDSKELAASKWNTRADNV